MLKANKDKILLDCGLYQGRRSDSEVKNKTFPFDPKIITNMILSHGHIDHSGRIPLLVKNGFRGSVFCTRPTLDACRFLLMDSAHIQESDAAYLNYKSLRNHLYNLSNNKNTDLTNRERKEIKNRLKLSRHELNTEEIEKEIDFYKIKKVKPLYTKTDAENALQCFSGYPYDEEIPIGKSMSVTFFDAGHILGSALCFIKISENGKNRTICYTGDIGRFGGSIVKNPTMMFPEEFRNIDLLITESTYGVRSHGAVEDLKQRVKEEVTKTVERGGSVIIPAFAFGRTQEVVYVLHELYDEGAVPKVPVFVDSPLGRNLTEVFGEHPEVYDKAAHKSFLQKGKNPFSFNEIRYISSVEESMEVLKMTKPHIVIASAGMCEAGRILHHLRYKIHNPLNNILIVGFMAENTLGRRIMEKGWEYKQANREGSPPELKFLNKTYPLKAEVSKISGFSAHADQTELTRFLKESNLNIKKIAVVHGEEDQSKEFVQYLKQNSFNAFLPEPEETRTI
ncbi:MAG: MBL fold metallo-hydrolase RNA specificity domain-containing protein, partial [Thermodesulfobacteriota bacterium]